MLFIDKFDQADSDNIVTDFWQK